MDGSLFLVSRQNTSLARRCRKGAIHPIIRSPPRRATKGFEERQAERLWTVFRNVSLAQRARRVFGGDLNCSGLVPLAAELTVVCARQLLFCPNSIHRSRRLGYGGSAGPSESPLARHRLFGIRRRRRSDLGDRAAAGLARMAGSARSEVDERPSMRAPRRALAAG